MIRRGVEKKNDPRARIAGPPLRSVDAPPQHGVRLRSFGRSGACSMPEEKIGYAETFLLAAAPMGWVTACVTPKLNGLDMRFG